MTEQGRAGGSGFRREVGRAAAYAALTWATYGLVETYLVLTLPHLRRYVAARHFGSTAFVSTSHVSPLVTAIALSVYPLAGAILGGLAAACYLQTVRLLSKDDCVAIPERTQRQIGSASLSLVTVLYLIATRDAAATTVAVIVVLFTLLYRFVSPGPMVIALLLVGMPFLGQPRSLSVPATTLVVAIYATAIPLIGVLLRRLRPGRTLPGWMRRPPIPLPAAMVMLACLAFAANLAMERTHVLVAPSAAQHPGDNRPNVILISLDTVRADHLSLYGYQRDTTPNLKRFAATSTVFTRALATSNYTLPSHASMLTGLNPEHHGARDVQLADHVIRPIAPRATTVAEALALHGYLTGAVVANFGYLVPELGFARGFAWYQLLEPTSAMTLDTGRPYLLRQLVSRLITPYLKDPLQPFERAEGVTNQVQRFLDAAAGRQPFFLFVNYMDAHDPYRPPAPYDTRFPGKDASFKWAELSALADDVSFQVRHLSASDRQHLLSQYDGAIAYLDDQLERIFGHLRSLGVFDNSLIIVTSDHGEAFDENGIMLHGASLYDHQIHVPLIVKFPNASVGEKSRVPVSGADLMPTILDVAGVSPVAASDGRSIRHLEPTDTRPVISESYKAHARQRVWDGHMTEVSLSTGALKLIQRADGGQELYDLTSDPEERTSLIGQRDIPDGWTAMLGQVLGEARLLFEPPPGLDPVVAQRLRSLGYIR